MSTNLKQIAIIEIDLPAARFRLRRLDPRNLVIERQNPRGDWLIDGYYNHPVTLASALVNLAADQPADQADELRCAVQALTEAIDTATARIIAALADGDDGGAFGPRFGG